MYEGGLVDMTGFSPAEPEHFWGGVLFNTKGLLKRESLLLSYDLFSLTGGRLELPEGKPMTQKSPAISSG
jgi:hypothetical protein